MKTIGYVRVSGIRQDVENQKLEILTFANKEKMTVEDFIAIEISSRRTMKERRIEELLERLDSGDTLIVSELSRLGRSLGEIIQIVDSLIKKQIRFIAIKQGMLINGRNEIQTKVMITMFGLFAEIERDLLSERTKMGLANAKAKGKKLGRPMGRLGRHKLDGKEKEIGELLSYRVSKSAIARKFRVSRTCLVDFIQKRNINPASSSLTG
jgi:DNA invertase Pin-like site-specific DNA recombinase